MKTKIIYTGDKLTTEDGIEFADQEQVKYLLKGVRCGYATHHEPQDETYELNDKTRKEAIEFGDPVLISPGTYEIEGYQVEVREEPEIHSYENGIGCHYSGINKKYAYLVPVEKKQVMTAEEAIHQGICCSDRGVEHCPHCTDVCEAHSFKRQVDELVTPTKEPSTTEQEEIHTMIAKVHEHIEGRYELDSYDFGIIHALLCKLQEKVYSITKIKK